MKTDPARVALSRQSFAAFEQSRKWLYAPKGSACLYVAPAAHAYVEPLVVSHGWSNGTSGSPLLDDFLWTGTMDPSTYLSVPAAIQFQRDHTACVEFVSGNLYLLPSS